MNIWSIYIICFTDFCPSHHCETLNVYFVAGYAYFTDWRIGGIVRVRKSDGGEITIIRRGINNIMHVKAYDAHSQIGKLVYCVSTRIYAATFCFAPGLQSQLLIIFRGSDLCLLN